MLQVRLAPVVAQEVAALQAELAVELGAVAAAGAVPAVVHRAARQVAPVAAHLLNSQRAVRAAVLPAQVAREVAADVDREVVAAAVDEVAQTDRRMCRAILATYQSNR